jgi:hypothetical protein
MKEINQIIHLTNSKEILESILKNGFYTSYNSENFGKRNILIPMISFANILFRDIGENEVVDYGKYGIVFDRDFAIKKFDLNPVFYVKNDTDIDLAFKYNFENSIVPQTLKIFKNAYVEKDIKNVTDYISINPISEEIKNLLNTLDKNVNDDFLQSLKVIFENYFVNSLKQALLLKPFKVQNKAGVTKIAYNEREWRKSFFNLHFISEHKPDGTKNEKYTEWLNTKKPHYTNENVLNFELSDVKSIYVTKQIEIEELKKFIVDNFGTCEIEINTLEQFKSQENDN